MTYLDLMHLEEFGYHHYLSHENVAILDGGFNQWKK